MINILFISLMEIDQLVVIVTEYLINLYKI